MDRGRADTLRQELAQWAGVRAAEVGLVRSPYRICPLGAHVDHQLGEVTGMALDRALLLAFAPRDDGGLVVRSHQFPETVQFPLSPLPGACGDWADYARGAVFALQQRTRLTRGLTALVDGHDSVAGLSSSAAAGVAYLLALETVNGLRFDASANVDLDRVVENEYIGLQNGILDQSIILRSRPDCLTHLDCRSGDVGFVRLGHGARFAVAVLFSGLRAPLSGTDYNLRVGECREAAARLLRAAGMPVPDSPRLRAVPPAVFDEHGASLPPELRKRAAHFFGEQERVRRGLRLWREGDLEGFGRLVTASGRSSIENYECGNAHLRAAYEALKHCRGI
ncbi:MAG: galactokinase family protein, partial [Planctomycetota bacterium]